MLHGLLHTPLEVTRYRSALEQTSLPIIAHDQDHDTAADSDDADSASSILAAGITTLVKESWHEETAEATNLSPRVWFSP